jgi:cyclase
MKKRIILQLLVDESSVYLSRGFTLQRFCSLKDAKRLLHLENMADSCDEVLLLYIGSDQTGSNLSSIIVDYGLDELFVPLTVGGGVNSKENFRAMLRIGADKVVVSSSLIKKPTIIEELVQIYGSQAVVYPMQLRYDVERNEHEPYCSRGKKALDINIDLVLKQLNQVGVGEILSYDLEKDGSGTGYNTKLHKYISDKSRCPVIACGGDGKATDIAEILKTNCNAACISNLFSFMDGGISRTRQLAIEDRVDIINWL